MRPEMRPKSFQGPSRGEAGRKQISSEYENAVGVDCLIVAHTMVYQSKQKLRETQGQFLPQCGHRFLKMWHAARDEAF